MPEPGDAVTWQEAARILDRSMTTVARLVAAGELPKGPRWEHRQLSRRDVERLSLARWQPAESVREDAYWVTTHRAAALLGVNGSRVRQLVAEGRIPYETTPSGQRLFRRQQLEVIGNARRSRRLAAS
jgi:excisionase family DNA binding protein